MTTDEGAVSKAILTVLSDGQAMGYEKLEDALLDLGVDLGDDPAGILEEALDSDDLLWIVDLPDERMVLLPALLDGRMFTHRLTAVECGYDVLEIAPDFQPMAELLEDREFARLRDGTFLEVMPTCTCEDHVLHRDRGIPGGVLAEGGALLLPAGLLTSLGLAPGDLVGLRFARGGLDVVRVDVGPQVPDSTELTGAIADALEQRLDHDAPMDFDVALWSAMAESQGLFRTLTTPLGEALDTAGFGHDDGWLAPPELDLVDWSAQQRARGIRLKFDLSTEQAEAVDGLLGLFEKVADLIAGALVSLDDAELDDAELDDAELDDAGALAEVMPQTRLAIADLLNQPGGARDESGAVGAGSGQDSVRGLLRDFTNPAAAEALIWSAIGPDADDGGALVLAVLAGALESHAPRAALANLRWTQAKACERFGQVLAAESLLRQAFDVDSDHIAVLNDLARYASDRGDTTAGLAYLRRAGQDADEELVEVLERYQAAAHRDLGSKEPCWCGSGRRYKRCHLGKETAPLVLRVDWLHHKIGRFLSDGPWHEEIYEVAQARAQFWDRPDAFRAALTDPLVADTVLSEGGALDQFLMDRGVLLPADELLLAQQWALIERSVYEVEAVRPGQGFEARDLRTGERQVVQERSASRQLKVGDLICARLLPCVDSVQVFGGIEPVALYQRTGLMELLDSEPDPVELVDFLSARYAPPTLQNTEGEPLMFCQATLHIPDPAAMAARLDEAYESDESSEGEWVENVQTHGATRVRAFLRLSGDELSIETNSESRLDRVLDTVIGLQPQAQVVSESRTPFGQLPETDDDDLDDDTSAGLLDQQDPAVQQLLAQVVRECEVKWLDQSIPALSGATPREAAADPTRRQDVIRLIDSFPSAAGPGAMDPERLRADLGLV